MRIFIASMLLVISVLFVTCGKVTEKFAFHPQYPQPSQEITITYNPKGTLLEDADEVMLLAYCFPDGMPLVKEIVMDQSGSSWRGSFSTDDTTLAVYIIFRSGEKQDDNDKNGYLVSLFTADNKPVKGGLARQAEVSYSGGPSPLRFKRDFEKARAFYEKEFEFYPEQKQNWRIVNSYWNALNDTNKDSSRTIIKPQLEKLGQIEKKTIRDLSLLVNWHQKLHEINLADKYEKELLLREPGFNAEWKRFMECLKETSIDEKRKLTLTFIEYFPRSNFINQLQHNMVSIYIKAKKYKDANNYINTYVKDPSPRLLDELAWAMIKSGVMLERAIELAEIAVKKTREERESGEKPKHYTTKEWRENHNRHLADNLNIYGYGLNKMGKFAESVLVFEEAVELNRRKSKTIRKRYCRALYESGQIEKAFSELQSLIKEDPSNQELRTFFKKVYIKHKGREEGLESFFAVAERDNRIRKQDEIKARMIDKPAPSFALNDLSGNKVRLADYADKIVILDFWGTWCGVCLQSFPAMQQVVNKYKEDDKINFLFIDTLEKIEHPENKVREIISKNNYTFHVLLDVDNSMANAYKITSAPMKIIIGPNGNIRFRIKGYGGDEKLIEELDMMIGMLR